MYGQFHNAQSLRTTKSSIAKSFTEKKVNNVKIMGLISLIFLTLSVSVSCFAGPSQPRLKGGNGNAQGR
jgi:hypothetical protein